MGIDIKSRLKPLFSTPPPQDESVFIDRPIIRTLFSSLTPLSTIPLVTQKLGAEKKFITNLKNDPTYNAAIKSQEYQPFFDKLSALINDFNRNPTGRFIKIQYEDVAYIRNNLFILDKLAEEINKDIEPNDGAMIKKTKIKYNAIKRLNDNLNSFATGF